MPPVPALIRELKKRDFAVIPSRIDPFCYVALRPGEKGGYCVLISDGLEGVENYTSVLGSETFYRIYIYDLRGRRWYRWKGSRFLSFRSVPSFLEK